MLGCLCRKKLVQVYSGMPCRKELLSDLKINGHLVLITGVDGVLETLRFSPLFLFLFNPTAPVLGLFDQMEMLRKYDINKKMIFWRWPLSPRGTARSCCCFWFLWQEECQDLSLCHNLCIEGSWQTWQYVALLPGSTRTNKSANHGYGRETWKTNSRSEMVWGSHPPLHLKK